MVRHLFRAIRNTIPSYATSTLPNKLMKRQQIHNCWLASWNPHSQCLILLHTHHNVQYIAKITRKRGMCTCEHCMCSTVHVAPIENKHHRYTQPHCIYQHSYILYWGFQTYYLTFARVSLRQATNTG